MGLAPGTELGDAWTQEHADRLDLYRYLTADNAVEYIAIMRLFAGTLLADLSAAEVAARLAEAGSPLDTESVEERCKQLVAWGNLVPSVRDARVPTVADWKRSRSRFQVSKLGGRIHRQVDDVLRAADGAREVARELLGGTVDLLDRILARASADGPLDAEALAADVTTVFNNQLLFTESVRDFYAYLNSVLSRYDLAGEEYAKFKGLLLDYVDLISADVIRHTPAVVDRLDRLAPHLDRLIAALATLPTLTAPDGSPAERLPGRDRADWDQFTGWYTGRGGRSGPAQLRAAAEQALGQLITNAKRMLAAAGTGVSRRADLLRLAAWFANADTDDAHRLFAATFGAHPARHLLRGPDEPSPRDTAATSWWDAEPVDVPVSLRERGDRTVRGRTPRVPDPGLDRERLLAEAHAEAAARRAAATELAAAGQLHGARVSPAARDLLLERLGDLLAVAQALSGPAETFDSDLALVVRAEPDPAATTVVHAEDGTTTIHGIRLTAAAVARDEASPDEATAAECTA